MKFLCLSGFAMLGSAFARDMAAGADVAAVLGPEMPSVQGPVDTLKAGESYNPDMYKPKVAEVFKPHLFNFVRPKSTAKSCEDLVDGLTSEGTVDAQLSLVVVLGVLNGVVADTPNEIVGQDKNVESAMNALSSQMIREGASDGQGDLVHSMGDLIECIADVENQRTILQLMALKGMEKSLKTSFAMQLMRGSSSYDPSTALDIHGNNLLHLGVMSGGVNTPKTILQLEQNKNKDDATRRINSVYWALSSLLHRNDNGMRPLDLCVQTTMSDELKRLFRNYTLYFRVVASRHGISKDMFNEAEEMLKTSGTLAAEAAQKLTAGSAA